MSDTDIISLENENKIMGSYASADEKTPLIQSNKGSNIESFLDDTFKQVKDTHAYHTVIHGKGIWFLRNVDNIQPQYITNAELILMCSQDVDLMCSFFSVCDDSHITVCIKHDNIYCKKYSLNDSLPHSELIEIK